VNWIPETDEKIKDVKKRGLKDFVEEDGKKNCRSTPELELVLEWNPRANSLLADRIFGGTI